MLIGQHKRWVLREVDPQTVARQSEQLDISSLLARILVLRDFADVQSARRYLSSSLRSDLPSPFQMADMEPAVRRLAEAGKNKQQIGSCGGGRYGAGCRRCRPSSAA